MSTLLLARVLGALGLAVTAARGAANAAVSIQEKAGDTIGEPTAEITVGETLVGLGCCEGVVRGLASLLDEVGDLHGEAVREVRGRQRHGERLVLPTQESGRLPALPRRDDLIAAETAKKEAEIALQEARIQKEKERELAAKVKIAADAEAYRKSKVLQADGALEMKLATIEKVAEEIARGWAKRKVPQTVIVTGEGGDAAQYTGSPEEVKVMLGMMLADMAKNRLSTDLTVPQGTVGK